MTKKTLYLIHHSHTDIGYTDRQEKISRQHVAYLRQAVAILQEIASGRKPEWEGYCYTCENFWQVKQFLTKATPAEIALFEEFVAQGKLDISLSYLNFTELVEADILAERFTEAKAYTSRFPGVFDSAMTADINGFAWGYSEKMYQSGIRNFFSCLHTHHGMFPLFKKQQPFWWETPSGERLLVWNGDHYQIGNDFLFSPNTDQSRQYGPEGFTEEDWQDQLHKTEELLTGYFETLTAEDYPYDFIPVMISGIVTDNSPTSARMMEGIHRWNALHGEDITVELVTLNHFFAFLRQQNLELPVYQGDWPDWWADGVGSTPAATKLYRDAQRTYHRIQQLDPEGKFGDPKQLAEGEENLLLYAEHTWGFHSSVAEPWDTFVNVLDMRKAAYATNAHRLLSDHLDDILEAKGACANRLDQEPWYRVINPFQRRLTGLGEIYLLHWQTVTDSFFPYQAWEDIAEVVDALTGAVLPSQVANSSRGKKISFWIDLEAKEERQVFLRRKVVTKPLQKYQNTAQIGTELVADIAPYPGFTHDVSVYGITTADLQLTIDLTAGITSIRQRSTGQELLHPNRQAAPFVGIYEVTTAEGDPCGVRRKMGRNRKAPATQRSVGVLKDVQQLADGPIYAQLLLTYQLAGTQLYQVELTVYKKFPRIDAMIRIEKNLEWSPENLYVSLPFTIGVPAETVCYLDKSGGVMRPGIDQLPGTNTSFYLLHQGIGYLNQGQLLYIAPKDTPLVTMGSLASQLVTLASEQSADLNHAPLYSWVMNNFWETNFKVDLSGFYEFAYQIQLFDGTQAPTEEMTSAGETCQGVLTIPCQPQGIQ